MDYKFTIPNTGYIFKFTGPNYIITRTFDKAYMYNGCQSLYVNIEKHHEEEFMRNKNRICRKYVDNLLSPKYYDVHITTDSDFYTYKIEDKMREANYDDYQSYSSCV